MRFLIVLLAGCGVSTTFAASNATIDKETLHQNGVSAQILNAEFQTLKDSDPCDSGQMACIKGSFANCAFGSWKLQRCFDSQKCFALPSVNSTGTILTCTSEAHALSLMAAVGVTGGLTANSTNTTVVFPTQPGLAPSSSPVSSFAPAPTSASSSSTGDVAVVTVTVTLPLTMPPSTTILRPEEALSILASLSSAGYSISTLSSAPLLTSSASTVAETADADTSSATTESPTVAPPHRRSFRH